MWFVVFVKMKKYFLIFFADVKFSSTFVADKEEK